MKKELLYEVMNDIEEKMLNEAAFFPKKKKANRIKWLAAAACLCVASIAVAVIFFYRADTPLLFRLLEQAPTTENELVICQLQIDDKTVLYERVSDKTSILKLHVGELWRQDASCNWYHPSDVTGMQYLICESDENLALWKFQSFALSDETVYTYGDLYQFFGVDSASDIVKITTVPSQANNTDLGKSIQKEVGTRTYTDPEDIRLFYASTVNVIFCTEKDWSDLYDPGDRFSYRFSTDATDKLSSGESTYATRVITLTLSDGTEIDSMRYDALGGHFYEYGGIHTIPLDEETVYALNELFGIR